MADTTSAVKSHHVYLVAPNGKEQPVILSISQKGVALGTAEKELSKFPFEVIKRWMPSDQRSKNPGKSDCLDLQVMTSHGARDLRMRCSGGITAVQDIMQLLRMTAQDISSYRQTSFSSPADMDSKLTLDTSSAPLEKEAASMEDLSQDKLQEENMPKISLHDDDDALGRIVSMQLTAIESPEPAVQIMLEVRNWGSSRKEPADKKDAIMEPISDSVMEQCTKEKKTEEEQSKEMDVESAGATSIGEAPLVNHPEDVHKLGPLQWDLLMKENERLRNEIVTESAARETAEQLQKDQLAQAEVQQVAMEAEIIQLKQTVQKWIQESEMASQCKAEALSREQKAVETLSKEKAASQAVEEALADCRMALTRAEQVNFGLDQSLREATLNLSEQSASALSARIGQEHYQRECAVLRAELSALQQRSKSALDTQAELQVDLEALQSELDSAKWESGQARDDALKYQGEMCVIQERLLEVNGEKEELCRRIEAALSDAHVEREARLAAEHGQAEIQKESEALRGRLQDVRDAAKEQASIELLSQLQQMQQAENDAKHALEDAEQQVAQLQAVNAQLLLDIEVLRTSETSLKAELHEALDHKSRFSLASLNAMERLKDLETSRDEACKKLDSSERQLQAMEKTWKEEKASLQEELLEMRRKLREEDAAILVASTQTSSLKQNMETQARELQEALSTLSKERLETASNMAKLRDENSSQINALRTCHEQEVRRLTEQLHESVQVGSKRLLETERLVDSKERQLARWREEALGIAPKLELALSEHKRELEQQQAETEALKQRCGSLDHENSKLASELSVLQGQAGQMASLLDEAGARHRQLALRLMASENRESELHQEVLALQRMQEGARLAVAAARRQGVQRTFSPLNTRPEISSYQWDKTPVVQQPNNKSPAMVDSNGKRRSAAVLALTDNLYG